MSIQYSVQRGDTLSAIARRHGITWQQLYNHPDNAEFRRKRPNPNLIFPGDVVMIPSPSLPGYEVPGMTLIPQDDNTSCWYASAQMLIHWKMNRLRQSLADLVPPELDAQCRTIRDAGGGIVNPQILGMAQRLGLRAVPPMSPTPQALRTWLQQYGPLWVNGQLHIVVIAGIKDMQVKVYDPWPPKVGKIDWRSLTDWYVGGKNPPGQPDSSRDTGTSVTTVFLHCP
jgi:hypothetical protein